MIEMYLLREASIRGHHLDSSMVITSEMGPLWGLEALAHVQDTR